MRALWDMSEEEAADELAKIQAEEVALMQPMIPLSALEELQLEEQADGAEDDG